MRKVARLLAMVTLVGLLVTALVGPAAAEASTDPSACWNNCGIGSGPTTT